MTYSFASTLYWCVIWVTYLPRAQTFFLHENAIDRVLFCRQIKAMTCKNNPRFTHTHRWYDDANDIWNSCETIHQTQLNTNSRKLVFKCYSIHPSWSIQREKPLTFVVNNLNISVCLMLWYGMVRYDTIRSDPIRSNFAWFVFHWNRDVSSYELFALGKFHAEHFFPLELYMRQLRKTQPFSFQFNTRLNSSDNVYSEQIIRNDTFDAI